MRHALHSLLPVDLDVGLLLGHGYDLIVFYGILTVPDPGVTISSETSPQNPTTHAPLDQDGRHPRNYEPRDPLPSLPHMVKRNQ